ncbi:hypothetical protein ACQ5SO_05755 [Rhodovulum sp. DZ06]|uniref:hypothetical protein n=1 Tax=Rhodovulum sp. DZ06 TaxID=3425126 RepID=UPI003D32E540
MQMYGDHPVLGRVDLTHVPLFALREHFPEAWARLQGKRKFAVVREPRARFRSSLNQHAKVYLHKRLDEASEAEVAQNAEAVIAKLRGADRMLPAELIHFQRQSDYIVLDGERVVDEIVPLQRIARLYAELSGMIGQDLDPARRRNQRVPLRFKGLAGPLYKVNDLARNTLPAGLYHRVKSAALPIVSKSPDAGPAAEEALGPAVEAFVDEFYADDLRLYGDLVSAHVN